MCSHYQGIERPEAYRELFQAEPPAMQGKQDMWPCSLGVFIRRHPHADVGDEAVSPHEALIGQYGLVPHWASDLKLGRHTYNARSETVAIKPSFRDAWRHARHCIIPAMAIYEPDWRTGKAVPTRISRADGQPMGIAGLWDQWKSPRGEVVHSFTMLALSLSARDSDEPPGERSWTESHLGVDVYYTSLFVTGSLPAFGPNSQGRDAFESQGARWYRGYLAEYPDGSVFEQAADEGDFYRGPKGMDFSEVGLLRGGEWEYDYSYTTPERPESISVPCQDLVKRLGLIWDRQRGWVDGNGELVAFETRAKRRNGLFVRRDTLNGYLEATKRTLVYRRFANRGLFSQGGRGGSQINLFTWMSYFPSGFPQVLSETKRPFNC